jgi:ribulose-phosphate 3-epimerase
MSHLVAPSILAGNYTNLGADLEMINKTNADWLHVDIMDGVFVPNISFGPDVVKAMKKVCTKPFDVHLMIVNPDQYLTTFRDIGAEVITVHYEACTHLHRTLQQIRALGCKAGVAINPHTNVALLDDVLEDIDLALIMSVNPGFGGQKFIYRTLNKVRTLRNMIEERNLDVHIEIDGGVGLHNAEELLKAGADVLVAGNTVFSSADPIKMVADLKNINPIRTL